MDCWCASKIKSWFYWLLILMMILIMMVCRIEGGCIEEERKALLKVKASLIHSYGFTVDPLASWVDDGSIGGECCDWERVNCNTTTTHVTILSLSNIVPKMSNGWCKRNWLLNVSVFVHFKELLSLDLSSNCLDDGIVNTGLGRLSSLKKLELLDLSDNHIGNDIFPSLGDLTFLKVLHLGGNNLKGYFPALGMFLVLPPTFLINICNNTDVILYNYYIYFKQICSFGKLGDIGSLVQLRNASHGRGIGFLGFVCNLFSLRCTHKFSSIPLPTNYYFVESFSFDQVSLLKKLKVLNLRANRFNESFVASLSVVLTLKSLDLSGNYMLSETSFPAEELSKLPYDLEVLLLSGNDFNGTLPIQAVASLFHHLHVLDLSGNNFVGSIPSKIQELSSIRVVSFADNKLNGSLLGLCELKNLNELDLSGNMFDGNLPQCFNSLSSLKLLDISSNHLIGSLPPSLFGNLTSLEYVDGSDNKFEGAFSFSSFASLAKLKVVRFVCNNDKFEMETEEPMGWIPTFQLKVLVLSGCNINRHKGSVVPRFLLHQRTLRVIDLSHNYLEGHFPNWLIKNSTMLEALNLRNNSLGGTISMPSYRNANLRWLDMSENHMIGTIPGDIQTSFPSLRNLNLSRNSLDGSIPSSVGDLNMLWALDLSDNELSGEVPKGLFTNIPYLKVLKLSKNLLHGKVLSGNLSFGEIYWLALDNNCFTGKIGNGTMNEPSLEIFRY
ncbi:hypothetical protein OSB04_003622 [Centaurea solstitialis]|uniref:Leucine-rich repeat-containing N-terminal plant-type domain-containing protein n=1 Tax=Centaurea solstitialis TaxID=347529 RepID=A0AA38U5N6_9ASTR|nr:hypothetical protein OSB04_003622 [Centaurea solstitialis]